MTIGVPLGLMERVASELSRVGLQLDWSDDQQCAGWIVRGSVVHAGGETAVEFVTPNPGNKAFLFLDGPSPALIVSARITARTATVLRDRGQFYADALGNTFFATPGVHVEIQGRKPQGSTQSEELLALERQEGTQESLLPDLFTPKRAQVVFALLTWPHLIGARLQDIADASGVSLGTAHQVTEGLETWGYLRGGRLDNANELVRAWLAAYPSGLGAKLGLGKFSTASGGLPDPEEVRRTGLLLGGESAAGDGLFPATMTVYTPQLDPRQLYQLKWRRDPQGLIDVRRQFWTDPSGEVRSAVPPLLTYADLKAQRDSRLDEAAAQFAVDSGLLEG